MADIEWGNVAEWVAPIGTIAALIFALVVLKGELEARGEAREDRRLRYAGGVTGWLEEKYVYEGDPPEEYVVDKHWVAFVTNARETPVYKCVVLVGPSKHEPQGVMSFEAGTLAPGRTHESYVHDSWLTDETKPTLQLTFTDSTSRTWSRLVMEP